ncbi:cupin domain-containing protein [Candidatus Solirubrobacter pratensis]|uniref:cupin domain-containing protein n=1 Tax=Candidatus Solirubrobacter pratensis TaxID=1298857 RepID=UPI0004089AF8|nr:cupin domain-containing protein [Candidatus Solirubrobacter pratensis]
MAPLYADPIPQTRAAAGSARHGAVLTFETIEAFVSRPAPVRMRRWEDTLLRVVDGIVRLTTDGEERKLGIGEEAILPAGTPHQLAGVNGAARVVIGFRAL